MCDEVVPEPPGGAHRDPAAAMKALGDAVERHLTELALLDGPELRADRYERFRRLGAIEERA